MSVIMMANSGRKINYSVRPAKNIERKMFKDMLLRLSTCFSFYEYQYIGFGSKYFVDFILLHKSLHISDMISIEHDIHNKKRYEFNSPYSCIDIKFGSASEVLPSLDLNKKSIVWLDYDSSFSREMLGDVSILVSSLPSESIVCLTYNSQPYKSSEVEKDNPHSQSPYRDKFIELFGEENIPIKFDERGWTNKKQFSKLIRQAIVNQIDKDLKTRELRGEDIRYEQIMYFDYSDGSHMSSLAFIIGGKEIEAKIKKCNLTMLPFYQKSDTSYCIEVPNLTAKEIRHLSEKMPSSVQKMIPDEVGITDKDVENFCKNYKYYPTFTEVEII